MKRFFLALGLPLALMGVGATLIPESTRHWALFQAADDPSTLSRLRLDETLSATRLKVEVEGAIAAQDPELAQSLMTLAAARGLPLDPQWGRQVQALNDGAVGRAVQDFGQGFVMGERDSDAGFAGALAGDVTGFGDLRDLAIEGRKWLGGENADQTVLVLAAAGLVLSAATFASFGGALPARNGLSAVKAASKARLVSPALGASLARMTIGAVDRPALQASLAAATRLDLAGARLAAGGIVRPAAMTRLGALGQDAGALYARTGQRGLRQVLAVADDAGDLRKAARLSAAEGSSTRAILKLLGRGALVLGALSLSAVGWMLALIGYAVALAMLAQRFGWWLGRVIAPRRRAA